MELGELQSVWDDLAKADPLWAILTDPDKTQGRWDTDEFFATGRAEIDAVMQDLARRGIEVRRGRCLDFGCGVGRLTQALAEHFEVSEGVDISPTMIQQARRFNKHPSRCLFHLNAKPDLSIFPTASFDFVYSNIVLQHIAPNLSELYVREFVRLLAEGGVAVFQVPSAYIATQSEEALAEGAHRSAITIEGRIPLLETGSSTSIRVRVRNSGDAPWPLLSRVRLGNHWRSADGETCLVLDDGRGMVPVRLAPGESAIVDLVVRPPEAPGKYVLELDMVEEGVCWFVDRGSEPFRAPVSVSRPGPVRTMIARRRHKADVRRSGPRMFELHGLPRDRVIEAVTQSGGRILEAESYNPVGDGWDSYRYFVTKPSLVQSGGDAAGAGAG